MRPSHPFRKALGVLAALPLILLLTTAPPASASPPPTWTLYDGSAQYVCQTPGNNPGSFGYYLAPVLGEWTTTISLGMTDLPPGSTSQGSRIPPGSNHPHEDGGVTVNGWIGYNVTTAPLGLYHPRISATDGVTSQSYLVTLEIKQRC
ncbi:DUF5980 family protein [Phytohabitans sp. ZYX-F-186]|uniref:DUF5980 family protein n=1 Tax=Phytohabitans maris TaxID=3071409 RepID=A0ABU0ZI12_9ACTN|nr:DUF5980 family protein [Phytohabitans sp. ZYX-F-186]MDQ7906069.1 DUF5980 family protein [Phytohabitans sp. ZYX-F-186]